MFALSFAAVAQTFDAVPSIPITEGEREVP
jgi:hypothetical protein